jgi:hypothetical protein
MKMADDPVVATTSAASPSAPASPPGAPPAPRAGTISASDYHRLPPAEQDRFANLPDGQWIARSKLPSESGDGKQPDAQTATGSVTDDGRLKIGELLLSDQDIRGLIERRALEEGRKATVPATAAEYSLDLPSDFVIPEGQNWKWSTDHPVLGPIIGQAKELAHSLGMDQAGFSKMMSLYAAVQINESQMIAKAAAAEREKLGPNIVHRVDAVSQFIRSTVGDDKIAKAITQQILTADAVIGWEKIIRKVSSQGAAQFSQAHREPGGQTGRVSEEQWAGMSPREKWDYARGFDQQQFKANSGG